MTEKNNIKIDVPKPVAEILGTLEQAGFEAYTVGGCVRDSLLGREPEDWDICTSALPSEVKKLFRRTVDTGIRHGTVTVMLGKTGYEVTTYRVDGAYADGRHPDHVTFTPSLLEDLQRRDFTINAMAYSPQAGFVDAFGGIGDLAGHLIRCVGEPRERFSEDALRILRAVRFSAQLGFSIEERTYAALGEIAPNLVYVSRERIQVELTKLLLSDHPEIMLQVEETGMAGHISPALERFLTPGGGREELRTRLRLSAGLPREKMLRWAALFAGGTGQGAAALLRELKLDNDTILAVRTLTDGYRADFDSLAASDFAMRRFMSSLPDELLDRLFLLVRIIDPARAGAADRCAEAAIRIRARGDCYRMKDLAVSGKDLIAAGMQPGKTMGDMLGRLFERVLQHPSENEKAHLLDRALRGE
jgi:tRNA nucleotidyltransferase (CCA-adding enzyme)